MGARKDDGTPLLKKRTAGSSVSEDWEIYCEISDSLVNNLRKVEGGTPVPAPDNNFSFGGGGGSAAGGGSGGGDDNGLPVTLADIGGLTEEINFIKRSILYPLTNQKDLAKWGFIPPKGVMFYGSPGTGKTLLAKAIADELTRSMKTKVKFIYRKGADCHSKWFGQSSANLRAIFAEAEKFKPALIFFDEIDGLCPNRQSSSHTSEVYTTVVTTFLGMMDQIKNGEVFVIAATNRLDSVDPALRRPGRFDKELRFSPPDEAGRKVILKIHTKQWKVTNKPSEALLGDIAAATSGYTGASLNNLCSQASNCAVQRYKKTNNIDIMTGAELANVVVEQQDWFQALRHIGRPKTNVFGSVSYVAQSNPTFQPLLAAQVDAMKNKILKLAPFEEHLNSLESFLIYAGKDVVSTFIIPELLSTKELQNIPVYLMDFETITQDYYNSVGKVTNQVASSTKECILYIPNCDVLFKVLAETDQERKTGFLPFLVNKLRLKSGRPVLILGTASSAPRNLPEEAKSVFPGSSKPELSYKVRIPNEKERRDFLQMVLNKNAYNAATMSTTKFDTFFGVVLEKCVKMTEHDPIEYLIDLHNELFLTGKQFMMESGQRFGDAMLNVVKNYRIL